MTRVGADLEFLEAKRVRLHQELARLGDLRRGSITVNFRRCGKPNCACVRANHRGHGPQYLLVTKSKGRSHARTLKPGPAFEKLENEIANHRRFRELVSEIIAVNEAICELRPAPASGAGARRSSSGAVHVLRLTRPPGDSPRRSSSGGVRILRPTS